MQNWVEDNASLTCLLCVEKFTYSNRRHHCRTCGALVCDNCSSKRLITAKSPMTKSRRNSASVPLSPKEGASGKRGGGDRVCDGCFNKLAHECFLWQQAVQKLRRAQEKLAAEAPELLLNEASLASPGRSVSQAAGGGESPVRSGGMDRARNVATETRRALEQRGERLEQVSERSEIMRQVRGRICLYAAVTDMLPSCLSVCALLRMRRTSGNTQLSF